MLDTGPGTGRPLNNIITFTVGSFELVEGTNTVVISVAEDSPKNRFMIDYLLFTPEGYEEEPEEPDEGDYEEDPDLPNNPTPKGETTDEINIYPKPSCYNDSSFYSVTVNGMNVPVYSYNGEFDYASFSAGKDRMDIEVTVKNLSTISKYSITPQKLEIPTEVNGNKISFSLEKDQYLILAVDGARKLVLAIDPPETDVPAKSGEGIFNVTDAKYGADNTGKNLSTAAIQKAIDDAHEFCGGVVYIPAGVYLIGNLTLKSNVNVYLEGGAVLRAVQDQSQYTMNWHKNSINEDISWWIRTKFGAKNIKIYGRGTIDGDGYQRDKVLKHKYSLNLLVPLACEKFTVDGITFRDSDSWAVIPVRSNDLTFTNVKFLNRFDMGENDGIDVCESQNVVVRNAIGTGLDDPFTTKTWAAHTDIALKPDGSPAWPREPEKVENVLFEDCISWTYCYGFKVGQGCLQDQKTWCSGTAWFLTVPWELVYTINTVPARFPT